MSNGHTWSIEDSRVSFSNCFLRWVAALSARASYVPTIVLFTEAGKLIVFVAERLLLAMTSGSTAPSG